MLCIRWLKLAYQFFSMLVFGVCIFGFGVCVPFRLVYLSICCAYVGLGWRLIYCSCVGVGSLFFV